MSDDEILNRLEDKLLDDEADGLADAVLAWCVSDRTPADTFNLATSAALFSGPFTPRTALDVVAVDLLAGDELDEHAKEQLRAFVVSLWPDTGEA